MSLTQTDVEQIDTFEDDFGPARPPDILAGSDRLHRGIWPRSFALMIAAVYLCLYIIRPWETLFPWMALFRLEFAFAVFMLAVVFVSAGFRVTFDRQTVTVLAFVVALALSYTNAWDRTVAWSGQNGLYVYLSAVAFYFVILSVVRTPYQLVFLLAVFIVTMAMFVGKSQWEYLLHGAGRFSMGVSRLTGIGKTFAHPNNFAAMIVVSLPMSLFLYRQRGAITATWPTFYRVWFHRGLLSYGLLAIPSIVMTQSRGGMLAGIAFVGLVAWRGGTVHRKINLMIAGVLFLCLVWVFMPESSKNRFQSIWDPTVAPKSAQESAQGRIEGVKAGLEMFRRFPLTGVGIDNFTLYRTAHVDGVPLAAHNIVGQALGEVGLIGSLTFCLMVFITWSNASKVIGMAKSCSDDVHLKNLSDLTYAVCDSLILLALIGLFSHNLYRFFWLWLAAFAQLALYFARQIRDQNARSSVSA